MKVIITNKQKREIFVALFQLLKNATSHLNSTFEPERLYIQGVDKTHVCLFEIILSKDWFDIYEVDAIRKVCLDTSLFLSIISTKCDDQHMSLAFTEDTLLVEFSRGDKKGDYDKYFEMPLSVYDYEEVRIVTNEHSAEFSMPSKKITDMFNQLSTFGDDITIACSEECVDFKTKETSAMRVNVSIDELSSYGIVEGETITLNYSLIYLNKMCITNKLSADIDFFLSDDSPMKINYDLGKASSLTFYIAPKMADD